MFKIRLSSISERVSLAFALKLIPALEIVIVSSLPACALLSKETLSHGDDLLLKRHPLKVVDIDTWSWENASHKVKELADNGIRLLLISDAMWDWQTQNESINEELDQFERALSECGVSVITIEDDALSAKALGAEWHRPRGWQEISISDVLKRMICEYRDFLLVMPWGNLPFFIICPMTVEEVLNTRAADCFVGYPNQEEFFKIGGEFEELTQPLRCSF